MMFTIIIGTIKIMPRDLVKEAPATNKDARKCLFFKWRNHEDNANVRKNPSLYPTEVKRKTVGNKEAMRVAEKASS